MTSSICPSKSFVVISMLANVFCEKKKIHITNLTINVINLTISVNLFNILKYLLSKYTFNYLNAMSDTFIIISTIYRLEYFKNS